MDAWPFVRQHRYGPRRIGPPLLKPGVERRQPAFDQSHRLLSITTHLGSRRRGYPTYLDAGIQLVLILVIPGPVRAHAHVQNVVASVEARRGARERRLQVDVR